jgi:phenylacetate-CoA ligase
MKQFPLLDHVDLHNPHYLAWLNFLDSSESWSADQIAAYQLEQLQNIVALAYSRTPGYQRHFNNHNITPQDIKTLQDIQRLPFIDKEIIRDQLTNFSCPDEQCEYVTTSGSTGIPFGFYRHPRTFARELASKAHQYRRIGWQENSRQLVFRGLAINTSDHMQYIPNFNELRCSSYHLTPDQMERYYQATSKYRPDFLRCYPSAGYQFARYLHDTRRTLPVKAILCASENLYPHQKQLLSTVFQGRVFSHYGHYELAALAGFCEYEDTYHVLPQYSYVELVDQHNQPVTQPGQLGEIIGTSFLMRHTPFIRYRTRDFATLKGWNCPSCQRPYQIWERIDGRLQEFIVTKSGHYISMTTINMHDTTFDTLKQFQFEQNLPGELTFSYLPHHDLSSAEITKILNSLTSKLGKQVTITPRAVKHIPPTPRGKHRFLIQNLKLQFGDT